MRAIARTLGISRSNLMERYQGKKKQPRQYHKEEDKILLPLIREIVDKRESYGYRRVTPLLNHKLLSRGKDKANHKRVYRIMKNENLLLTPHGRKPARSHHGKVITIKSNMRWCSDIFGIQCFNGERVFVGFSLDTCDREAISYVASTIGIDGQLIRDLILESVERRFGKVNKLPHSIQWLSDNGSCYVARETVLFARGIGFDVCTTPAYSPQSNGMAEAFVKTFKRDYVVFGNLNSAYEVMQQLPMWFEDYNEIAPHKGLKMKSPRQFLKAVNGY